MKKRSISRMIAAILAFTVSLSTTVTFAKGEVLENNSKSWSSREIDIPQYIKKKMADDIISMSKNVFNYNAEISITEEYIEVEEQISEDVIQCTYISLVNSSGLVGMDDVAVDVASNYDVLTNTTIGEYLEKMPSTYDTEIAWSVSVTFAKAVNDGGYKFYRPTSITASWEKVNSSDTVTMSSFSANYISRGWLTTSPDCLEDGLSYSELAGLRLTQNEVDTHQISVSRTNLAANTSISSTSLLPSGQTLWFANAAFHGSTVDITCSYTINGITRTGLTAGYSLGALYGGGTTVFKPEYEL